MAKVHQQTYRLSFAYNGLEFAGFQQQPGLRTIEGTLRSCLGPVKALSCGGRTDRGVHAIRQVVSFRAAQWDAAEAITRLQAVPDFVVGQLVEVPRWFHARFSATGRRYVYLWDDGKDVPVEQVRRLLHELCGRRCFSAFARDTPVGASTVRYLRLASARATGGPTRIRFDFGADSFLRRQVRILVATAIREARQHAPSERLVELAASGDRRQTAPAAPPGGLFLTDIHYAPRISAGRG